MPVHCSIGHKLTFFGDARSVTNKGRNIIIVIINCSLAGENYQRLSTVSRLEINHLQGRRTRNCAGNDKRSRGNFSFQVVTAEQAATNKIQPNIHTGCLG